MAEEVAEATDSLNKDTGMVDLKSPIEVGFNTNVGQRV